MKSYPHFRRRRVHPLDGSWEFAWLGKIDVEGWSPALFRTEDRAVVPSAFDAMPATAGLRGAAAYRTRVMITPGTCGRLQFEGVSMWCQVFVDGKALGTHACGWTGFFVEVPPSPLQSREVVVLVDNRFDRARVPLHEEYFDFYHWGGLIRSVYWHEVPRCFIDRVEVRTLDLKRGEIGVRVLLGGGNFPEKMDLEVQLDDGAVEHDVFEVKRGEISFRCRVKAPRLWSPDSPHLYHLAVSTPEDDMVVRFGLRKVEIKGQELLLNGRSVRLLGYNRHESHPQFGPTQPEPLMLADLQQLRELGCNFIRGSHYPQNQRFLDLCDEMGFLVWEEMLGWQQKERHAMDPIYVAHHDQGLREMVAASFNHPCVIMWGCLNECDSHQPALRPLVKRSVALLKKLDDTRPVTFASNHPFDDRCLDLVDVVAINTYPAWYDCEDVEDPLPLVKERLEKIADTLSKGAVAQKPCLISEIGAEGLYGWRDAFMNFWDENYQAALVGEACRQVLAQKRFCGIAIWHFSDARTYARGRSLGRARAFNNKGTLDEYRRPKAVFAVVREIFRGVKVARPGGQTPPSSTKQQQTSRGR